MGCCRLRILGGVIESLPDCRLAEAEPTLRPRPDVCVYKELCLLPGVGSIDLNMLFGLLLLAASAGGLPPLSVPSAPAASSVGGPMGSSNGNLNGSLNGNLTGNSNGSNPTHPVPVPKRACGTGEPSPALVEAHRQMRSRKQRRASPRTSQYSVDTVFHIVSTADQKGVVTAGMIANQLGALQAAYSPANISFRLVNVSYAVNDSWATDSDDADMKLALRQGDYATLNIYFQTNLSTDFYGSASQLLGYCTLPTNVSYAPCDGCAPAEFPAPNYAMDGCNVHAGSMPNGALAYYDQGKTAVHEVGHWFGLLHTFQDNSCDPADAGDYIDDTPQQAVSTDGCPAGKDSCPASPGLDPIHNFMDYSTDACYDGFTAEQIARMQAMYGSLRYGY